MVGTVRGINMKTYVFSKVIYYQVTCIHFEIFISITDFRYNHYIYCTGISVLTGYMVAIVLINVKSAHSIN